MLLAFDRIEIMSYYSEKYENIEFFQLRNVRFVSLKNVHVRKSLI